MNELFLILESSGIIKLVSEKLEYKLSFFIFYNELKYKGIVRVTNIRYRRKKAEYEKIVDKSDRQISPKTCFCN